MVSTMIRRKPLTLRRTGAVLTQRQSKRILEEAQKKGLKGHEVKKMISQADINPAHNHTWTEKWEGTYRYCECGLRQWRLACWTNQTWQYKAPGQLLQARPDVTPEVNEGLVAMWTDKVHLVRNWGMIPQDALAEPIAIIGAGSIGSFTALALHKMGFEHMAIWDGDNVAKENMGTQLYGSAWARYDDSVQNVKKPQALHDMLNYIGVGRNLPAAMCNNYTTESLLTSSVVISAVDSMSARKIIWENVKRDKKKVNWFVDARMGAEFALMYIINPSDPLDVITYEKTLHADEDAIQESCTQRSTVYTALLIAGMISKGVKDALTGAKYPRIMHWNIKDNVQQIWTKKALESTALVPYQDIAAEDMEALGAV